MRKVFVIFLFSVLWGSVSGQPSNQLNQFILESVCSYVKDYNSFAKQINYDTIQYICVDGLPDPFPYDSLPCDVFSLQWMEGNHPKIKKDFKHSTTVAEVTITINNNVIGILVSTLIIKVRNNHIQISRWSDGGRKQYYFTYSCVEGKWLKVPNRKELLSMIDTYFYHYGEYPYSLESFLAFYDGKDSVNATITYFSERERNINWTLNNKSVLNEELLVEEKGDTLLWFSGKKHLPYFDDLIDGYEHDYLEYPQSLNDLINYDRATRGMKEESFDRCIVATLRYLEKYKDQLGWQSNDSLFLLTAGSDTITYRFGPSYGASICESDDWAEKVVFLFFDKEGTAVFSDDIILSFKKGFQEIRKTYKNDYFNVSDYHILKYTTKEGLQKLCKSDTLSLNTEWFTDVDSFLRQFTSEYELEKVIFVSAPYKK